MDERFRCVSRTNSFNNQLNRFISHMAGWVEPIGLRQQDPLAAGKKLPVQGHGVREQMAQTLRVSELAEQTSRVSLAYKNEEVRNR